MTAPLTPERLAEVRARADGINASAEDRAFIAHARTDVVDLLAALDAATERAEKAEGALARVEALAEEWERKAGETSPAWSIYGPQEVSVPFAVQQIREAMGGKP